MSKNKWKKTANLSYAVRRKACKMKDECKIVPETETEVWGKTEDRHFDHFFRVTICHDQAFTCYHIRTKKCNFNSDGGTSITYMQGFQNSQNAFLLLKNREEFMPLIRGSVKKLSVDIKEPSVTANVSDSDSVKATVDSESDSK